MIKFRQKEFTIQEGHYTGPKDMDKVPSAVEVIGKGTVGGAVLGGIIGKIANDETINGIITGGKLGFLGSVLLKMFVNYLHNPMTSVKYREVDKNIRRQFGIYRASGITVGDTIDKRASVDEKFSFNDRNVTSYKLNFAVSDNQITMYTYGLTQEDLEKVNKILDYYCKKFFGMEYTSAIINQKLNSYSVSIVFTNYQAISSFIMELSNSLETKINLLDNKAFISARLEEGNEKSFSVKEINKYEFAKILSKSVSFPIISGISASWGKSLSNSIMNIFVKAAQKLSNDELIKSGAPSARENFGNSYLEDTLKKLHYIEGFNYTVGDKNAEDNFSIAQGRFIITTPKNSDSGKELEKLYRGSLKSKLNRCDTGKVLVFTYTINSKQEFEFILKKLMQTRITFNIFE